MTTRYSTYYNTEITEANSNSVVNDNASSFISSSSSVNITQVAGNSVTQSGTVTATHAADTEGKRIVTICELAAGATGLTNTSLDFDLVDAAQFIQGTPSGISFDGTALLNGTSSNISYLNPDAVGTIFTIQNNTTLYDASFGTADAANGLAKEGKVWDNGGKFYFEVEINNINGGEGTIGLSADASRINSWPGFSTQWMWYGGARKLANGSSVSYGASYTQNDIIGVALDLDNHTLTFYKNGVSQGVAWSGTSWASLSMAGRTLYPTLGAYLASSTGIFSMTIYTNTNDFNYSIPVGFEAWGGTDGMIYPTTPSYITTSDQNQIDLSFINKINSCSVAYSEPANTTLKALISFDGRTTWKAPIASVSGTVLDPAYKAADGVITNGGKTGELIGKDIMQSSDFKSTGKWYWEVVFDSSTTGEAIVGFAPDLQAYEGLYPGGTGWGIGVSSDGDLYFNNSPQFTMFTGGYTHGDVIGFALDIATNTIRIFKNGVEGNQTVDWTGQPIGSAPYAPTLGTGSISADSTFTIHTDSSELVYSAPAGYNTGWGTAASSLSSHAAGLTSFDGAGNIAGIEAYLTNLTITDETYLDFAFQLSTTDSGTTPYVDQITLNYDEHGFYRTNMIDYQIDVLSSTQTKVTKLSSGTKNIKVNVLV